MTADAGRELITAFELHDVAAVARLVSEGHDPRAPIDGKPPLDWLTEMYTRSDRFPSCLKILLDHGAEIPDPALAAVLLDDVDALAAALAADPGAIARRFDVGSCFTPLVGASLLHVAAEFGHGRAARTLLAHGADPNVRADLDPFGLNGHTPIFHTVNSAGNRSAPVMRTLLDAGAACDVRLVGLVWGRGFDWETTLFDLTPISYCQFGILPQFHRREVDVRANVLDLLKAAGRTPPPLENVPNKYLSPPAART